MSFTSQTKHATVFSGWNGTGPYSVSLSGESEAAFLTTTGYGFNLPSNAVVRGVQVEVQLKGSPQGIQGSSGFLTHNGNLQTQGEDRCPLSIWSTSPTWMSVSNSDDLWDLESTLTPTFINDASFGYSFNAYLQGGSSTGYCSDAKITVFYEV